jgi:glutaconate CoA-transferase, subunit A
MMNTDSIDALAAQVPDGAMVAMPAEQSFVSMAMVRALIQRGVKDLHLLCVPIGSLAVDMLIGAGCVRTVECAAVSLGEFGLAPRFSAAVESGQVEIKDSTCPAIHAALQASEKGVPFMPLSGLLGTDILANRDDWKVVDDPLGQGNGPIVLLPAIQPDYAIFHVPLADSYGDVWIGRRRELVTLAHAAKTSLVTTERITNEKLVDSDTMATGTLPNIYIGGVAPARRGAKPLGLPGYYPADVEVYRNYARMALTDDGFRAFMDEFLADEILEAAE